jgi:EAL domain-containing protein (putative c-di-GMP-specific phosphodiesterase class I)
VIDGDAGGRDAIIAKLSRAWPGASVEGAVSTRAGALRLRNRHYDLAVIASGIGDDRLALAEHAVNEDTAVLIVADQPELSRQLVAAGVPCLSRPFPPDELLLMSRTALAAYRHDRRQAQACLDIAQRRIASLRDEPPPAELAAARRADACGTCRHPVMLPPLTMAFQPIVDLGAQTIVAHEALVRGAGDQTADDLLGGLTPANRYAFDQLCRTTAIDLACRLGLTCDLHVNFMPEAIHEPNACLRQTLTAARLAGFPFERLVFEVVELRERTDDVNLAAIFAAFRQKHFKVALDDFGAGYSNLSRMEALRPDIVKLDRALIGGCDHDAGRLEIIASIAGLCQSLDIRLIAEGVETQAELAALRHTGVNFFQGFFFAKPAFERLVPLEYIEFITAPSH